MFKTSLVAGIHVFLVLLLVSVSSSQALQLEDDGFANLIDSAHAVALTATVSEGRMISNYEDRRAAESEIRSQLRYSVGQLNGVDGVGDLAHLKISVQEPEPLEDGRFLINYVARMTVMWSIDREVPESFELILPSGGDLRAQRKFFDLYSDRCIDSSAHDLTVGNFWYFYRPLRAGCALSGAGAEDLVLRVAMDLVPSKEQTSGKSPEYHKVWEDGRLVFTAIFGKNEASSSSPYDPGVRSLIGMYNSVIAEYGEPDETTLELGERPGLDHPWVSLVYDLPADETIEIHLFLIDSIRQAGEDFYERYNELTEYSDFVGYSGHSGLGANIRALAGMGQFSKGQYQIFLVNGCDTFAYVDDALRNAHQRVNPDFGKDKFIDVITNAMPSYFSANPRDNFAMLKALVEQERTYRQILADFDRHQRATVSGEQDNSWPDEF